MNNKSSDKKEFYLIINFLYQEKNPFSFFLKIIFFKLFVGISPLKM